MEIEALQILGWGGGGDWQMQAKKKKNLKQIKTL
jgi:hypothetical protein